MYPAKMRDTKRENVGLSRLRPDGPIVALKMTQQKEVGMKAKRAAAMAFVMGVLLLCGCGGESGGLADEPGNPSISKLSDIPDNLLDPKEYDLTTKAKAAVVSRTNKGFEYEGDVEYSRAGCEADRMKRNVIRNAILPETLVCYLEKIEQAMDVPFAGEGQFKFWNGEKALIGEHPATGEEFVVRIAAKRDGDRFTTLVCNGTTKMMEIAIGKANNMYTGHIIDVWRDDWKNKMDFETDGPPSNFTTARFTQSFIENDPVWGSNFGSGTLEATPISNTVYGYYNQGGVWSFSGSVYGKYDEYEGSAKYRVDDGAYYYAKTVQDYFNNCVQQRGESACGDLQTNWLDGWINAPAPEGCALGLSSNSLICFAKDGQCPSLTDAEGKCAIVTGSSNVESFKIDSSNPYNVIYTLAGTSAYAADVEQAELPATTAEPIIEFTDEIAEVDCAESVTWTDIVLVSQPDFTECNEMELELDYWDTGDLCDQEEAASDFEWQG